MIEPYSRAEIEHRAQVRFGPTARLFTVRIGVDRNYAEWWGLAVDGKIIGCRRQLSDMPALIARGPLV